MQKMARNGRVIELSRPGRKEKIRCAWMTFGWEDFPSRFCLCSVLGLGARQQKGSACFWGVG